MNSLFFPQSLFFTAPPMVQVPSFFPAFCPVPAGAVFSINQNEPIAVDPAEQVRSYMSRPRNVLFKATPKPVEDVVEEHGGLIVEEAAVELFFPLKCGKLLHDNNVIPTTESAPSSPIKPPEVEQGATTQAADPIPVPATAKEVVKQRPIPSSVQRWPTRQSIICAVALAAAAELEKLLLAGGLESRMQLEERGTLRVYAALPDQICCDKATLFTQRVLDCDRSRGDRPYSSAIWQKLGESIQQRVIGVPFNVWVDLFRDNKCVHARAMVEWGK
jgi:hypothetical protein